MVRVLAHTPSTSVSCAELCSERCNAVHAATSLSPFLDAGAAADAQAAGQAQAQAQAQAAAQGYYGSVPLAAYRPSEDQLEKLTKHLQRQAEQGQLLGWAGPVDSAPKGPLSVATHQVCWPPSEGYGRTVDSAPKGP